MKEDYSKADLPNLIKKRSRKFINRAWWKGATNNKDILELEVELETFIHDLLSMLEDRVRGDYD